MSAFLLSALTLFLHHLSKHLTPCLWKRLWLCTYIKKNKLAIYWLIRLYSIDNSEWMRNGDYTPTRLVAQNEAVNLIFSSKTQANRENTVGLMTMAGKSPEVLVTLTSDVGKILSALHGVKISNKADFMTGIQIAQVSGYYYNNNSVYWYHG